MNWFSRFLSLWVLLAIIVGITLGHYFSGVFQALSQMSVAQINLPVALLVWLMIFPMLLRVDYSSLHRLHKFSRGIWVTLGINWLVKPFSMALLGWLFLQNLFQSMLDPTQIHGYIAGLILLAAAPCTAMVFVWSKLVKGDPQFTLTQVALNDIIMIFAFVPIVSLLLGITNVDIPWKTMFLSVLLYIVLPVTIAWPVRQWLIRMDLLERFLEKINPFSMLALILTVILLFGFQGRQILENPLLIALLAVPIIIQVYFNAGLAFWLNRRLGVSFEVAGPSALIGASNFFELAVATAIALFGFESGAALATVVGVLVEVPVMLSVVSLLNRTTKNRERINTAGVEEAA
ncbi:MAG: arsenical-resistance protein [Gammaproteobacteria bacterium]|nr:MAG: arsenical-resistance protein [Gammaproteobacteria bacterium]